MGALEAGGPIAYRHSELMWRSPILWLDGDDTGSNNV